MSIVLILLSFLIVLVATRGIRHQLLRRDMLDRPNERSSHKQAVPRGGGWALLLVLLPGMTATALLQHNLVAYAGLIGGVALLAAISWMDDKRGIPPLPRLTCHILAAWLGSLAFGHGQTLFGGTLPFVLDRALLILGWAWFVNLYNFMDGIDGITGVETIAIACGTCLVMTAGGAAHPFTGILMLLLIGGCLGFLAHNWHPAKIFLGDVGSVPLGYLAGFCLVELAVSGYLIPALIIPLYYLADSGITISKRALKGEKIWQAHRQHFYQRAALSTGRHDRVVLWITAANVLLTIAALTAVAHPAAGAALAATVVALLLAKMHKTI